MAKREPGLRSRVTLLGGNIKKGKRGLRLGAVQVEESGAVCRLGVPLRPSGLVPILSFKEAVGSSRTFPRSVLYRLCQAELVLGDPRRQWPTRCSLSESS